MALDVIAVPVLVVGSGISGLYTALKLANSGVNVLLVSKNALTENNSRYAQGGIAAVLPENTEDSQELHIQDTLVAGAGLCNEAVVREILAGGHVAIADLLLLGVPFDKDAAGQLRLGLEGGHSVNRIIHAGGDATGKQVEMTLIARLQENHRIRMMAFCEIAELLHRDGACIGARAVDYDQQREFVIHARHTVLATGGAGRLYSHSTNPAGATGNGFSLAYHTGATLRDMAFVQFHPTAFYQDGQARFLVSEALRGEGGILRNATEQAFMASVHPQGDLAPRDIVTRTIYHELQQQQTHRSDAPSHAPNKAPDHVFLDMTHLPAELLAERFPTILAACERFGVDLRTQLIPVAPAAHYMMGGVAVDLNGQTDIPGLSVVGETVWTGLHGANRLASNSLLECMVLARACAHTVANYARHSACPLGYRGRCPLFSRWFRPMKPRQRFKP